MTNTSMKALPVKKSLLYCVAAAAISLLCCISQAEAKSYPPMDEAIAALESDNAVTVEKACVFPWLRPLYVFEPADTAPTTGFVFYPGGSVDPRGYAPLMHKLAALGFLTALVPMPLDLAMLGMMRARRVINKFPDINTWAIGGHSLGGVVSCAYAGSRAARTIQAVVLWASYPSETFSLADTGLKVLSVYGTNDGLSTIDKIEASRQDLPEGTIFTPIQGGNHTQFGYYGDGQELQTGDNPADITREQQVEQIISTTAAFLNSL